MGQWALQNRKVHAPEHLPNRQAVSGVSGVGRPVPARDEWLETAEKRGSSGLTTRWAVIF